MTNATSLDLTDDEYFSRPGVSQSSLKLFDENPWLYRSVYIEGNDHPSFSPALEFGTLFHELAYNNFDMSIFRVRPEHLSGINIPKSYRGKDWVSPPDSVLKSGTRRGKAFQEWKAEAVENGFHVAPADWDLDKIKELAQWESASDGGRSIDVKTFDKLEKMSLIMKDNKFLQPLLNTDKQLREVSIFWDDPETGLECKAKLDVLTPGLICDWKTSSNACSLRLLRNDICKFSYHWQAYWYTKAVEQLMGLRPTFIWVFIDKGGFGFEIIDATHWIDVGEMQVRRALRNLSEFDFDAIHKRGPIALSPPNFLIEETEK